MRTAARALILAAIAVSMSTVASGYYHWTYFTSRSAPFAPITAKFDLSALDDKTVPYFISDQPPSKLDPNDNYDSLLSQIQLAAKSWNIASSQLRLRFGGISTVGAPQAAPGIDVVFDDNMPPGLLAQTSITTPADLTFLTGADPAKASVPILRSRLQLRSDLTALSQTSFSDPFFMTVVHEFGHTVGLQHSMASATMATSLTRGTTKALPLSADDVAAVSLLYPAAGFSQSTGSISGQVTVAGNGVNLASVVAISVNGIAIGGMTNPDGTYSIDGIPPGDYYVYAHPLPPPQQGESQPAAIVPPVDPGGVAFPADTRFDTQFFPGTHLLPEATLVTVTAAATAPAINFNLQSRPAGSPIYNMAMYDFLGADQTQVQSPPIIAGARRNLVFTAAGLLIPNTTRITPGLSLSVIGGAAEFQASTLSFYFSPAFLLIEADANSVATTTPVAVVVNTPTDLYVLPAAFHVVPSQPPVINSVSGVSDPLGNATVTVAGSNLDPGMRFLFDGFPASGVTVNDDATLTMAAPPATGAHRAIIEALASDGQTSSQGLSLTFPPTFTYAAPTNPFLVVTPASFNAGIDSMVEIKGINTNFVEGQSVVGFGSSDIVVRKAWVMDTGRILMNISVSPSATPGPTTVTVGTALQVVTLSNGVQILPAKPNQRSLRVPILNAGTGHPGLYQNGILQMDISALPANLSGWFVRTAGLDTGWGTFQNHLYAFVLGSLPLGPTVVQLIPPSGDPVPPVLAEIVESPPVIFRADGPDGNQLDDSHFANAGDLITLSVARLGNPGEAVPVSKVFVTVGGITQVLSSVTGPDQRGLSHVQFTLSDGLPAGSQEPVVVIVRTRTSDPLSITLAPAPSRAQQTAR